MSNELSDTTAKFSFANFDLPPALSQALQDMNFTVPTPIQEKAIPFALLGKDVLGSAQTGTGKTAAFGIPLVTKLLTSETSCALVLTPTRELATQVLDTMHQLLGKSPQIHTALLIGGDPIVKQFKQLRKNPRLIVATPGRLNDHLERAKFLLKNTDFFVLDEMDRMLDMGFAIQIQSIIKELPAKRQTLMFSATFPSHIMSMANRYLNKPERVSVGSTTTPISNIKQEVLEVSEAEKYDRLVREIERRTGSIIVFVKTKRKADKITQRLCRLNLSADTIHGDLSQKKRERSIDAFRNKEYRIMIATDVASRGLDVPHIEHVINYDLPQAPEDYIHRIGRTARAGATGSALSFLTPIDHGDWKQIQRLIATK